METTRRDIIKAARSVKPFSPVASRLLEVINDPAHSFRDVVNLIKTDPAISIQLLKYANRFTRRLARDVETVEDAVFYLGDATVLALIFSRENHIFTDLPGYSPDKNALWKHSLKSALLSRYLVEKCLNPAFDVSVKQAYTGGLIHDIGKSILSAHIEKHNRQYRFDSIRDFEKAEKDLLGVSHSEVGCIIGETWQLPRSLRETICYHHTPEQASEKNRPLVYAVHLADLLSMISGTGTGVDSFSYFLSNNYDYYYTLTDTAAEDAISVTGSEFSEIIENLKMDSQEKR
ncbi:MAG: HDOD domain-containing protein [Fibrobacterota bacterium]